MSNNFIVPDASSNPITIKTIDTGAGHETAHVLADAAGTYYSNSYGFPVSDAVQTPKGFYQNTALAGVASTLATLINTTVPSGSRLVWIQPEGGDIRMRDDGTSPTAAVGYRIFNGTSWPYIGSLSAIKLISVTGTVTVNLIFYG